MPLVLVLPLIVTLISGTLIAWIKFHIEKKIRPAEATTHVNYCISLLKISKAGHAFLHNYLQVYRQAAKRRD